MREKRKKREREINKKEPKWKWMGRSKHNAQQYKEAKK